MQPDNTPLQPNPSDASQQPAEPTTALTPASSGESSPQPAPATPASMPQATPNDPATAMQTPAVPSTGPPPAPQTVPPAPAAPAMPAAPPPPDTVAQIAAQPHSAVPDLREIYATICSQIVKEQGRIIGALSYEQASQIDGLRIDPTTYNCTIIGEPLVVLETLVDKYRQFFGNAAVEVCREAAMHLKARLPDEQIPELLRA